MPSPYLSPRDVPVGFHAPPCSVLSIAQLPRVPGDVTHLCHTIKEAAWCCSWRGLVLSPFEVYGRTALTGSLRASSCLLTCGLGEDSTLLSALSYKSMFSKRVVCWPGPALAH